MLLRRLLAVFLLLSMSIAASSQTCARPGMINPLGKEIADVALREYREFNGHRINADGFLWKFGAVESEAELLHDPETGRKSGGRPDRFVWRRVWQYWLTLDRHSTGEALHRKIVFVPGLLNDGQTSEKSGEIELRTLFANLRSDDQNSVIALQESAVRAAMNDSAWSAAFISYVMDRVRLDDKQFRYSSAHWQYIKRAFEEPQGYQFRACDPRRTLPRVGDLLCMSRGGAPLKNFAAWESEVRTIGFSAPAHCEVITDVDLPASKMEAIGGNVLQSMALRRLKLNGRGTLSDSHHPDHGQTRSGTECVHEKKCSRENFNLQHWSVLLQLK